MSQIKERIHQALTGKIKGSAIGELLGFKLVSAGDGKAVFEMDVDERHANPMGTLHGGVLCDLADAAMGIAFATTLEEGESFTTLELKINFLRPVWKTHLKAEGQLIKRGRTIGLIECEVKDHEGNLVAKTSCTCMVLRGPQAQGR